MGASVNSTGAWTTIKLLPKTGRGAYFLVATRVSKKEYPMRAFFQAFILASCLMLGAFSQTAATENPACLGGGADVVFIMDNSGSMKNGDVLNGVVTPPGDPNGIRDQVIRRAMRSLRAMTDTATAGFVSFIGLNPIAAPTPGNIMGPEAAKLQHPVDISRGADGAAFDSLLHKVWKYDPAEAGLPKSSATQRAALTYWTDVLSLAFGWFDADSGYVKTSNHAIVMVSDGAIVDMAQVQSLIAARSEVPPVYGIHLGDSAGAEHLKNLALLTGGKFFVVSPVDTESFNRVMQNIVAMVADKPEQCLLAVAPPSARVPPALQRRPPRRDALGRRGPARPAGILFGPR
jgi:hypothetical protein